MKHQADPGRGQPRPFQVARWGKFWSLEPLFVDERSFLAAKGGLPPQAGDIVLAVPAQGDRRRIVEILGPGDQLAPVLKALLYAQGVRQGFSDEVVAAARAAAERGDRSDQRRHDLRELPTFTIDPDTARDFDDAISVQREGDRYHAWVHIADVSAYVPAGGPVDLEARQRTASVYLPLWAEPMLPEELSAGVCSLQAGQDRLCVTVEFVFDDQGRRHASHFYRSVIRSDHRLTYGFVDSVLVPDAPTAEAPPRDTAGASAAGEAAADAELVAHLRLAQEVATLLRGRRYARGALQIGSFEPEYRFDASGRLIGAASRPETPSHALVEEFMLAANEAVAERLLEVEAGAIYRVHESPDPYAVDALLATLADLGVPTPPFPPPEQATPEQVTATLHRLSQQLPTLTAHEGRGRIAFPQLLLRSLKQAVYSPENVGHFGLASDGYVHFTSPIRRYPDLVVHRALLHRLGLDGEELERSTLADVAALCSITERVIDKLELKADDIALCFLLHEFLGQTGWEHVFEGEIVGLHGSGLFIHFGGTYEGYLHVRRLGDDRYYESEVGSSLDGAGSGRRYRLGDSVRVRVVRVDKVRGRVDLELADGVQGGGTGGRGGAQASGGRSKRRPSAGRRRGGHRPGPRGHRRRS